MAKRSKASVIGIIAALFCVAALAAFVPWTGGANKAAAEETFGAAVYVSETSEGQKTKLGEYENIRKAVDAAVADNASQTDTKHYYTVEVSADCEIDITDTANRYTPDNMPEGLFAGNDDLTGIVIAGDIDITINGNGHTVVVKNNKAEITRGIRIRGDAHVEINDLEAVTMAKKESKCIETRTGGEIFLELNRVILQVNGINSQALCFGGSGYVTRGENDVAVTATCVATDCSFGTPIAGRKINGKEVVNYFDKNGDGVADDAQWDIPTSHYGIMSFVKVDLTLDNSSSGGFAAVYLKPGNGSTGSRNSVVNVLNNSYLRGYSIYTGEDNNFGAVVFESAFDMFIYYDYDNDGIIDYSGSSYGDYTDPDTGESVYVAYHYNETSNIEINVEDSTVEATSIAPEIPGNQYCFMVQTGSNTVIVSGNSALITDDEFRNAPTKAFVEYPGFANKIEVSGGRLFKWNELPEKYILSDVAVDDMLYDTLPNAVENAESGETVSLIRNITAETGSAVVSVASGKDITFDLNGKTLTLNNRSALVAIENDGTLTVKNGTIERTYNSASGPMIVNRGSLTLSGLYVIDRTDSDGGALIVSGNNARAGGSTVDLTIESGNYISAGGNAAENGSNSVVTVKSGTLESRRTNGVALVNFGKAEIKGGTFKGTDALVVSSDTEITGGVFTGGISVGSDAFVVKGGTFVAAVKNIIASYIADDYILTDLGTTLVVTQFTARNGLEYTGDEYAFGTELNALLTDNSIKITDDMTVVCERYVNADGEEVSTPAVVKNAGTYYIRITLADRIDAALELTIGRKRVSLENADFSAVKVNGAATDIPLESMTLYKSAAGAYSAVKDGTHTEAVEVVRGVIRSRGSEIELGLTQGTDANAYTVALANNAATAAGRYTATATLTVSDGNNYALYIGDANELARRGIEITDNGDGTFTVNKIWYIVDMNVWLVDKSGSDYAVSAGHVFGQVPAIPVPFLSMGDAINPDEAPTFDDKVHLALSLDGTEVSSDFRRYEMKNYINDSMPVGNYEFTVSVDGDLTATFYYEVYAATVNPTLLESFLGSLSGKNGAGKTVSFEWDGYMHVFDTDMRDSYNALRQYVAEHTPERRGCWAGNAYDGYYGGLTVTFNMDRMHNATYYDQNTLTGLSTRPDAPGLYTMYYMISAKNFAPMTDLDPYGADFETARRRYVYYVLIVRGVEIPTTDSVVYNGTAQKADVASSEFYTVDAYDGFADAGKYGVTLRLREPEYYYWKGKTLGEATATVGFEITKALNEFVEAPDIVRWIEGKFNEEENGFIGAAKFGSISYVITDTDDNVIFDAAQGIDKRHGMKAGTYILKATVAGNDNYNGLAQSFTIRILEKIGMPWWGTLLIVIGALLVAAAVIFILWKKGVFRIVTDKIILAVKTRASVDAVIASVRAAKRTEEAKKTVEAAKRREKAEERRRKAAEEKNKPVEERAAALEAKAAAEEARIEKLRAKSEAMRARAERMREQSRLKDDEVAAEAAATKDDE